MKKKKLNVLKLKVLLCNIKKRHTNYYEYSKEVVIK